MAAKKQKIEPYLVLTDGDIMKYDFIDLDSSDIKSSFKGYLETLGEEGRYTLYKPLFDADIIESISVEIEEY